MRGCSVPSATAWLSSRVTEPFCIPVGAKESSCLFPRSLAGVPGSSVLRDRCRAAGQQRRPLGELLKERCPEEFPTRLLCLEGGITTKI